MTKKELIKLICKREKGKSNVSIGDVREILKIIAQLQAEYIIETERWLDSPLSILEVYSDKKHSKLNAKLKKEIDACL